VELDEIDPIYYKSTYYVAPQGDQAVRPYALLREAMAANNKVAIASVLRTKGIWWRSGRHSRCGPQDDVLRGRDPDPPGGFRPSDPAFTGAQLRSTPPSCSSGRWRVTGTPRCTRTSIESVGR
jgi:DNA end-binding protein Ku